MGQKRSIICIIGVSYEDEFMPEKIFEEVIFENFSNLAENISLQREVNHKRINE